MKEGKKIIVENILDIIYPPSCGICYKPSKNYLCKKCEKKLLQNAIFGKNSFKNNYFENHYYLFKYDGRIRELILNFKFYENPYLFHTLTNFLIKYQKKLLHLEFYDIIIPVPISKKRFKTRGYNQSQLIAKDIARYFNIKFEEDVLKKIKNNLTQSTLNSERKRAKC